MLITPMDLSAYPQCLMPEDVGPTGPRSAGLHLTTILRDIAITSGLGKDSGFLEEDLAWFAGPGFLWERIWDRAHSEAIALGEVVQLGEIVCDGIIGTPDRIDFRVPKVVELKVRWKSARKFDALEKEFWIELMQIKSYCYMLQMLHADLVVFFVAGDWRPPVPKVRGVHLEFSEMELEETWQQVTRHARRRGWL